VNKFKSTVHQYGENGEIDYMPGNESEKRYCIGPTIVCLETNRILPMYTGALKCQSGLN